MGNSSNKDSDNKNSNESIFREFIDGMKNFKVLSDDKHNPYENKTDPDELVEKHNYKPQSYTPEVNLSTANYFNLSEHLWRPQVGAEDYLFYFQQGVQNKIIRKMRSGKIRIEATLDLHQLNKEQARAEFTRFIDNCYQHELRCICIIHGKGYRSGSDAPILKNLVNHWLQDINTVLGFCSCPQNLGGTGAVLVLLKRYQE